MLGSPIVIKSLIIHGSNRARKELGIPTANFDITNQVDQKLLGLPTGVYAGRVKLFEVNSET